MQLRVTFALLLVFICDLLFALVYVKFENVTFGWIRLKEQTISFERCYLDCYYEGEKCQGFTFTSDDNCVLIRQLFKNSTEGQAVRVGRGRVYVKDSKGLFSGTDVCIPNEMFPRLVKAMAVCEDYWVYLVETNSCYLAVYAERDEFSFEHAVNMCTLYDSHLASVHSAFEMAFINKELFRSSRQYWLGGQQEAPRGLWQWLDGTPFDYVNWAGGEPNEIYGSHPYCIFVNIYCCDGYWFDNGCLEKQCRKCDYVCKKAAPQLQRV